MTKSHRHRAFNKSYSHGILFVLCFIFLFLIQTPARADLKIQTPEGSIVNQQINIQSPSPRINLPGLNLKSPEELKGTIGPNGEIVLGIPYLAEYIAAVYKYAVAIASILAVVMIIVAGFQWTASGGSPDAITSAKKRIVNAVTGLVIALGSYTLLYTINPELVQFRALQITYVQPKNLDYQEGGDPAASGATVDINSENLKNKISGLGIVCNKGGAAAIPQIVKSMEHKLSYRYGGKGQAKDFGDSGQYAPFNKTCPEGNLCFDCSGFVNLVYACAGLDSPGQSTTQIFTADNTTVKRTGNNNILKDVPTVQEIVPTRCKRDIIKKENGSTGVSETEQQSTGIDYDVARVVLGAGGGKPADQVMCFELQPGDLLGWKPEGSSPGHVVMYIGDGQTVEASGGFLGRQANANPVFKAFSDFQNAKGYNFKYIRRAP